MIIRFPRFLRRLRLSVRSLSRIAVATVLLTALACVGRQRTGPRPIDQNIVSADELEGTRQPTLFEAMRIVRPLWFTSRNGGPGSILVYQDDQPVGGVGALRNMSVLSAARVIYMSPNEAQLRFGPRNGMRPAIVVESAR